MDFETATAGSRGSRGSRAPTPEGSRPSPAAILRTIKAHRHGAVALLSILAVLVGGAVYASRISEGAPRVVYSFALEEAERDAGRSLLIDINAADAERLQELPGVGPATAEAILEHRRRNGAFLTVEELDAVPGIGPATLAEIRPLATV